LGSNLDERTERGSAMQTTSLDMVDAEKRALSSDARRKAKLTLLLASLTMLGPFSIDTYLPAFPTMQAALPATEVQMQLSLTLYFVGFAIFTLFHGAVSDSIGRKPVIVGTLCMHAIGSIGCALAGSITGLLAFRLLQGMFAGAGFVVGRAIVRDLFDGPEAQRQLSRIQMLFAVAPVVAPILGGWLVAHLHWSSIFWFLASYALFLAAWAKFALPESHPKERRLPFSAGSLAGTYSKIFFNKRFQLLAAIPGINFMGFFVYIAGAPAYILTHMELSTKDFWMLFVPSISGITLGAWLSGRAAGKLIMRRQVAIGFSIMAVAALSNLLVSAFVKPNVWVHVIPIFVYVVGMALITPPITVTLLDAFSWARGSVSALQSSCHVAMMAVVTALIVAPAQRSLLGFAIVMATTSAIGFVIWRIYVMTHGDETPPPVSNEAMKAQSKDVYEAT
jgi:MFS transporter, DHA1 family, multidrug resistance protein